MGNCSVTLEHTQGYVAGGLMTMMAILVGCFSPSELFLTILIMGCCVFVAMLCFLEAASKETLDETGIYLKTSFAQNIILGLQWSKLCLQKYHERIFHIITSA